MIDDPLLDALRELLRELQPHGVTLIVGGGFGLVLRARYLDASRARTRAAVPRVRATEDLDCFLRREQIIDAECTRRIRESINRLGYDLLTPNFQFTRSRADSAPGPSVRLDFLSGPVSVHERELVKTKDMRIRPRAYDGLHAYLTPEAFAIGELVQEVQLSDANGDVTVEIPHPFTYFVLKLGALRDRIESEDGKYHALDLFTIWSMLTEAHWDEVIALRARYAEHPEMGRTRSAVHQLFGAWTAPGMLAVREQSRKQSMSIADDVLEQFRLDLRELLDVETTS